MNTQVFALCISYKVNMNVEIANNLVNLRKKSGLSQEALAEKIGVSRQAVSKWERAESSPDTDNLIALAELYDKSLDDMLKRNTNYESGPLEIEDKEKKLWYMMLPYPVFITIVYLIIGYFWGLWHPGWLLFLTIPLWRAVVVYIKNRKRKK